MDSIKLNGFTLLEVIIAMIISAIIIIISYQSMFIVQKEWSLCTKSQNELTEMMLLKKALGQDIEHASYILKTNKQKLLFVTPSDTIHYSFSNKIIRSINDVSDTFHILLSGYEIIPLMCIKDNKVVKSINLDIKYPIEIKNVCFNKYYTCADLMKLE